MRKVPLLSRLTILAILCLLTACGGGNAQGPTASSRQTGDVVTEEFFLTARDDDLKLYLRNKHPADYYSGKSDRTILLLHGALFPGSSTFDLAIDGVSWMDWLAKRGFDVYALDVRGYGKSSRPAAMKQENGANPIVDTTVAVRDVSKAVDFIASRRSLDKLSIVGWSWGASLAGLYANEAPSRIDRLVLLAPQWLRDVAPNAEMPKPTTWRSIPYSVLRDRLLEGEGPKMHPSTIDAWLNALKASDPDGASQNPPVLKVPGGAYGDMVRHWTANHPLWSPDHIHAPVLIIQGDGDTDITPDMSLSVFALLTNSPARRFLLMGDANHPMMLEKNRQQLFRVIQAFMDEKF